LPPDILMQPVSIFYPISDSSYQRNNYELQIKNSLQQLS